ncbi:hypothetical protein BDY17DRAFT_288651 [Neohortaea acidophila]|uniref:Transmembrane protein UsgS n=1 Tax=Neohortaea acidophila TaxID=245834 RepID=A0A6A6Q5F4_9PEZI|nr:uncharacterized protein BDY17DRAFT_288651 [Neohortaea acidophila]KAF2487279.1 hypothetical protein BDY17DRAFT_288651 [Neohortaea acidophila]
MSAAKKGLFVQTTSFEPNAILRGAQLTLVGAYRALQNPALFTSEHYRQAALAVVAGVAISLLVSIPTFLIQLGIRFVGLFKDLDRSTWDEGVIEGIHYVEHHVLQVPFFLMSFMRHLSPAMDSMFMDSLAWVDKTYIAKHEGENPNELRAMYYPNLKLYENYKAKREKKDNAYAAMSAFLMRFGRRAALSLAVYLASFLPYIGRFVLPAASFFTFNRAVGTPAAVVIFGSGVLIPKRFLIQFLQSYFSSRTMMRELLDPYFSRIRYPKDKKAQWFHDRTGVLYGFALTFFLLARVPLVGVLVYGIAEASTAYLITKITEPPPPPQEAEKFIEQDVHWKNKKQFLDLPLDKLDKFNISTMVGEKSRPDSTGGAELKGRQFS